jgi:Mrp family chromosome partitioning ATPase
MSRNFELLTEAECELDATDNSTSGAAVHAAAKAVAPVDGGDICQQEMSRLVQRVFLSTNGSAPRKVLFCGVGAESGSSSVCARAGRTLAVHSCQPVCLVDANLKSPRLSGMFGVDTTIPFFRKSGPAREQCVEIDGNLWLAGPDVLAGDGAGLASMDELKERLAELRALFEYVLIDAPGTNFCGDASLLGQITDATILVVEANSTRRLTARKAKEVLDAAGVRLLGTVLRGRSFPIPEKLYKRL